MEFIISWNAHVGHDSVMRKELVPWCWLVQFWVNVRYSDNVFVGARAAILNNVKIGSNCKIGICTPVIENLKKKFSYIWKSWKSCFLIAEK